MCIPDHISTNLLSIASTPNIDTQGLQNMWCVQTPTWILPKWYMRINLLSLRFWFGYVWLVCNVVCILHRTLFFFSSRVCALTSLVDSVLFVYLRRPSSFVRRPIHNFWSQESTIQFVFLSSNRCYCIVDIVGCTYSRISTSRNFSITGWVICNA